MIYLFNIVAEAMSLKQQHTSYTKVKVFKRGVALIALTLSSFACTQVPTGLEPPPPPNDPNLSAANQAFLKGDWNTLRALLSRLPGDGALLSQSLFYQAVILGFEKPKKAASRLKELQVNADKQLRQRATLYRLLFKARAGECLLTEGPLRRVYWPKAKSLPQGTRLLLEEALRGCDERNHAQHEKVKRLDHSLKSTPTSTVESNAKQEGQAKQEDQASKLSKDPKAESTASTKSTTAPNKTQEKKQEKASSNLNHFNHLSVEQRRGVTPYLQLWLPLELRVNQKEAEQKEARISPLNILLAESTPLFVDQREQQGERVELERLDIQVEGKDSVSTRIAELRSEVDALIAVTPNQALHQEVLAAVKTQQRPLFILTPYPLETEQEIEQSKSNLAIQEPSNKPAGNDTSKATAETAITDKQENSSQAPIWRIFPDQKLIISSLAKVANQNKSQGVGILLPQGKLGMKLLQSFQTELSHLGIKNIKYRMLSSTENWETVAQELRKWPVDTFIFTSLPTLSITSLVTHLASKGLWSAPRQQFSQVLALEGEQGKDTYRRFILWPSLYDQSVLDQVGRYLEGARTVSPVLKESDSFKALDQTLVKEVGRGAQILDALMQDVLLFIDEAIRLSEVKQITLKEAFSKLTISSKYLIGLDFTKNNALKELYEIEVHNQQFRLFKAQAELENSLSKPQAEDSAHSSESASESTTMEQAREQTREQSVDSDQEDAQ